MSDEKEQTSSLNFARIASSVPVLTLCLLLILEIWLRQTAYYVDSLNVRGADVWGCARRLEIDQKMHPELILVGSSLVLCLDQVTEGVHYLTGQDPVYLREMLEKLCGRNISCLNLGSGAQMASETYFLAEAACNTSHPPRVIIYGAALRDFVHDQLAVEYKTESFISMCPFVPLSVIPKIYTDNGLMSFLAFHFSYIYRNSRDYKNLLAMLTKEALENLPLDHPFVRLNANCEWRPTKEGYFFENWVPRVQEQVLEQLRQKNPARLRAYFKGFQASSYMIQNKKTAELSDHYFKALQELCHRRRITLVVVNMPLSPDTSTVIPPMEMWTFRNYLKEGAMRGNYYLLDIWGDPHFTDNDYKDGVHFTVEGVKKFSALLTQQLQEKCPAVIKRLSDTTDEAR